MNNYYTVTVKYDIPTIREVEHGSDEFELYYGDDLDEITEFLHGCEEPQICVVNIEGPITEEQLLEIVDHPPAVFIAAYREEDKSLERAFKKLRLGYSFYEDLDAVIDDYLEIVGTPEEIVHYIDRDALWASLRGFGTEKLPDDSYVRWYS